MTSYLLLVSPCEHGVESSHWIFEGDPFSPDYTEEECPGGTRIVLDPDTLIPGHRVWTTMEEIVATGESVSRPATIADVLVALQGDS